MSKALLVLITFAALESMGEGTRLRNSASLPALSEMCLRPKQDNTGDVELVACDPTDSTQSVTLQFDTAESTTSSVSPYPYLIFSDLCLSNYQSSMNDGVKVIVYQCFHQANQRWQFVPSASIPGFMLKLEEQGKCLSAFYNNLQEIVQTTCDGTDPNQIWELI